MKDTILQKIQEIISNFFKNIFASKHIIFSVTIRSEMTIVEMGVKIILNYCNKSG
jgi:hypothetical protein